MKKQDRITIEKLREALVDRAAQTDPLSEEYKTLVERIDSLDGIIEKDRLNKREIAKIFATVVTTMLTMGVGIVLTSAMNRAANAGEIDVTSSEKKKFLFNKLL